MRRRKSVLLSTEKPRRVYQDYAAIDQFHELAERKRQAAKLAHDHGHQLGPWRKRPNDPAGRQNAWCVDCNRAVVVCTETPSGFTDIYGDALTAECTAVTG